MSKQFAPVVRAGILGMAATVMFAGAIAQEALVTAIGAGLSIGGVVLAFKPTFKGFLMSFYH
jgi:hypothetical protein